jgi:uncharacterized OsmC-like protein
MTKRAPKQEVTQVRPSGEARKAATLAVAVLPELTFKSRFKNKVKSLQKHAAEPPRVFRRPFGLIHAAIAGCSSIA